MHPTVERIATAIGTIILGKDAQIRLAIACLLARGHLLIEDVPGVGKTSLAHVLAKVLGLHFQRIQFTSDLLPADILGVAVFERETGQFKFHPGPIFSQVVLADEVNRATPKTQSAMLEVMRQDYIRTALAKGLTHRTVVLRHALKNSLIPVVTVFGALVAGLLTGTVITESIFNLPGMGRLTIDAIAQRDYPQIQANVLLFGLIYTLANLAVDLSYVVLNPRIRYG